MWLESDGVIHAARITPGRRAKAVRCNGLVRAGARSRLALSVALRTPLAMLALTMLALALPPLLEPGHTSTASRHYAVDAAHSSVVFRVMHQGLSLTYGRFNEVSGEITIDPDDAAQLAFDVRIPAASIDTNNEGRDEHLRGSEFFDVASYPQIHIRSTGVRSQAAGVFDVNAELTLHGVTRAIDLRVEETSIERGGPKRGYHAQFTIRRAQFGMRSMLGGIGDEVTILVSIEARATEEETRRSE